VLDDLDVRGMDMGVRVDEVVSNDSSELLWGADGVLFGEDVDGLLLRIGCNNNGVVRFCVAVK
jgi:hypothetical protein